MLAWYCSAIVNKLIHSQLMNDRSAIYDENGEISENILTQTGQYLLGTEDQSQRFDSKFVRNRVFEKAENDFRKLSELRKVKNFR